MSIRVKGVQNKYGGRISVTIPWSLRYQDGINYLEKRREWIRDALNRQKKHSENAVLDGRSVGVIADGTSLNTLVSKIIFIEQPTMSGQLSVKIRTAPSESPEAMSRLWYSIDRPMMLKQIIFLPRRASRDSGRSWWKCCARKPRCCWT